jgi:Domain of unknown function (DUF4388)
MPTDSVRLAGKLEDVTLPGLLQMLAVKARTGKLTLTCREGVGLVVLRDGRIIYTASNSAREALGNILVCQGLIPEGTLAQALDLQHSSPEEKRLGAILVEMGALSPGDLDRVIRQQTTGIIREMCGWGYGFFAFDPLEIPEQGEVSVDASDLVLETGLDAGDVARESLDALNFETQPVRYDSGRRETGGSAATPRGAETSLASLKSIMAELRSPAFGGEITLWLLRHASAVVRRCVLFSISKVGVRGMGQIGLDADGGDLGERLRRFKIPAGEPSVFNAAIASQVAFLGKLSHEAWDERLAAELGGGFPPEVVVVPMVVSGNVVAALYGDNLPSAEPIGAIDGLELLMLEAGLAMEKTALEVRLRTLQERLGAR